MWRTTSTARSLSALQRPPRGLAHAAQGPRLRCAVSPKGIGMALMVALLSSGAFGCQGRDADEPSPQRVREGAFWDEVRSHAEWAEGKPTLSALADSADAAVVARLVSVEPGRVVQGDAAEDVYTELLVHAEVLEVLRDSTTEDTLRFSLSLLNADSLDARDDSFARAKSALPIDNVLLLLRQRKDQDYHRVVNGYGIWAETTRGALDAPLQLYSPRSGEEPFPYEQELEGIESVDQLIEKLR